jgi:hypothetical protein
MTKSRTVKDVYPVIFEGMKKDYIDQFIKTVSDYFEHPVLLTDEHYKLISLYPNQKINNPIYDSLYDTNTLPLDVISLYQQTYLNKETKFYEPFYSDAGPAKDNPRIFGEIHDETKIYGHIAIFLGDDPLQEEDLAITKIIIDAIRIILLPKKTSELSYSTYLHDLLDKKANSEIKSLAYNILSNNLKGEFALGVTPIGDKASDQAFAAMIINDLSNPDDIITLYKNSIVTLFSRIRSLSGSDIARIEQVNEKISYTGLKTGISLPFRQLEDIRNYYVQAYNTAIYTKKNLEYFQNVYPNVLFQSFDLEEMLAFIHPVLSEIELYDERHHTVFFTTLKIYCFSLANREETSHTLCIHRNTLLYRLNRIEELFHLDLDDHKTLLSLINSFQIYNTLHK